MRIITALPLAIAIAAPICAQPADPMATRAADLLLVLQSKGDVPALFAPIFLQNIPESQVREISGQISASFGAAKSIAGIDPVAPGQAKVRVAYEKSVVTVGMAIDPAQGGKIIGLRVLDTGTPPATSPKS